MTEPDANAGELLALLGRADLLDLVPLIRDVAEQRGYADLSADLDRAQLLAQLRDLIANLNAYITHEALAAAGPYIIAAQQERDRLVAEAREETRRQTDLAAERDRQLRVRDRQLDSASARARRQAAEVWRVAMDAGIAAITGEISQHARTSWDSLSHAADILSKIRDAVPVEDELRAGIGACPREVLPTGAVVWDSEPFAGTELTGHPRWVAPEPGWYTFPGLGDPRLLHEEPTVLLDEEATEEHGSGTDLPASPERPIPETPEATL